MMATKDQERKALEQIKKIVEGLGEDSYLAAAFDGCFIQAEINIDDDVCGSINEARKKAEADAHWFRNKAEVAEKRADSLEEANKRLCEKILSKDDLRDVMYLISEKQSEYNSNIEECEDRIIKDCEKPECEEFKKAVSDRKVYKEMFNAKTELFGRLEKSYRTY